MKIFISYTTRDKVVTKDFLVRLESKISDLGDIYIDLLHNHSKNKQARVESELRQADIFLLLSTDAVTSSPWVRWEIGIAESINICMITIYASSPTKGFVADEIRLVISNEINQLITTRTVLNSPQP